MTGSDATGSGATAAGALDARLVPAALGCWAVTVVAVVGGPVAAAVAVVLAVLGCAAVWASAVWGPALWSPAARLSDAGHRRMFAGIVAFCALVAASALPAGLSAHEARSSPVRAAADRGATITVVGTVIDDPRALSTAFARTVIVPIRLESVVIGRAATTLGGRVTVFGTGSRWSRTTPGQSLRFRADLSPPDRADLTIAVARARGDPVIVSAPGRILDAARSVRERLAQASAGALPADTASLLPAITVGDTSAVPEDLRADFRTTGLTHLTAVSGANFTFLIGAVLLLARLLTLGPRTATVVAAVVLVAFVVIARPSPSVLRAAVMGSIGLLAFVTGRRKHAVPALATAVIALLVHDPALAVRPGFVLSVTATAALIVLAPWITRALARVMPEPVAAAVAVAVAAQVVTAPVIVAMSGTVSTISVLANVAVAPVIGPITVVGALVAVVALIHPATAEVLARAAEPGLRWLVMVAERLADVPGASVSVPGGWVAVPVVAAAGVAVLAAIARLSGRRGTIDP